MKNVQPLQPINVPCWFPCHLIVSRPLNQIQQLIPVHTGIFHPFNLRFQIAVNYYRGGRRNVLPWQRIFCDVVQQRDMINWMNF
jgi:hypothetical protein